MKSPVIISILLSIVGLVSAQKQNNTWYFGEFAGLDFNTTPPSPLVGKMDAWEGCASVSDANGQLLFYTNGDTVWDRTHTVMPNGFSLGGGYSSTQAGLAVPLPGSTTKYYIFSTGEFPNADLKYAILDMSLNGGNGDIESGSKDILLEESTGEKIAATHHRNGIDYWIVSHRSGSNEFVAFLLTADGLDTTPITSAVGSIHESGNQIGPIRFSHDNSKIVCTAIRPFSDAGIFEMFDFDNCTGSLTNRVDLNEFVPGTLDVYGIEFSPNDNFLYFTYFELGNINFLYQLDLYSYNLTLLAQRKGDADGALQLGPDNKIYFSPWGKDSLSIIHFPDSAGLACQLEESGISLASGTRSYFGLPNPIPIPFYPNLLDPVASICIGESQVIDVSLPMGCESPVFLWNDGSTSSQLTVTDHGIYWVEVTCPCQIIRDTIQVSFKACESIVYYDLEACSSYMHNGTNMDYSEFQPAYPNELDCADVTAGIVFRSPPQENKHSCTPGVNGSVAMCISSFSACAYESGHAASLVFEVEITPLVDSVVRLTSLSFYEKAPDTYSWIDGGSGPNNYPQLFAIRILKNGVEVFRQEDISTTSEWTLKNFDFITLDSFIIHSPAIFSFELLPYCPIGNVAEVSAWDIDEISVFGGCVSIPLPAPVITGTVFTKNSSGIHLVEMQLSKESSFPAFETDLTNNEGYYLFDQLEINHSYSLQGYKNDDVLNGVSTIDLLLIRKHLLGITPFTSLDQYIAADINHNGKITVLDLAELQKVLLGINNDFPNNTSWRFGPMPQDLTGYDISAFNETSFVEAMVSDTLAIEFLGIKVGDISGDVVPLHTEIQIENRTEEAFPFKIYDQYISRDQVFSIPMRSGDQTTISGMQLGINLQNLELITVNPSSVQISAEDFSFIEGILRISWAPNAPVLMNKDDILFELVCRSSHSNQLSNVISLNKQALHAELYMNDLEIKNIDLLFDENTDITSGKYKLKIEPNPVQSEAYIHFTLDEAGQTMIRLFDSHGRLLYENEKHFTTGSHKEKIEIGEFSTYQGVIYCQVITTTYTVVEKFVKVE